MWPCPLLGSQSVALITQRLPSCHILYAGPRRQNTIQPGLVQLEFTLAHTGESITLSILQGLWCARNTDSRFCSISAWTGNAINVTNNDVAIMVRDIQTPVRSSRIPQMDWVGRAEGRGNAGETADSFFHPPSPSGLGYLIQRKGLI